MERKNDATGSGTEVGYFVEARLTEDVGIGGPLQIEGTHLTERWKRLHFPQGPIGVPGNRWNRLAAQHGVLPYSTANALMAWAAATLGTASRVIFRLVKVKMEYSWSITEQGVGEVVSFFEGERGAEFIERATQEEEPAP